MKDVRLNRIVCCLAIFLLIQISSATLADQAKGPDPWFTYAIALDDGPKLQLPEGVVLSVEKDITGIIQYYLQNNNPRPIYLVAVLINEYLEEPIEYLPLYKLNDGKIYYWTNVNGWRERDSSPFCITDGPCVSELGRIWINNTYEDGRPLSVSIPEKQTFSISGIYSDNKGLIINPNNVNLIKKTEALKIFCIKFNITYKLNNNYAPKAGEKSLRLFNMHKKSNPALHVTQQWDSGRRNPD